MLTVADVIGFLDQLAPPDLAADWDNVGLLLGARNAEVRRVMTCLTVTPESAAGGPLGLVRTGDRIRLDVPARRLELLVDDAELARRAATTPPPPVHAGADRGYARLFQQTVLQADEGCDFDFMVGVPRAQRST